MTKNSRWYRKLQPDLAHSGEGADVLDQRLLLSQGLVTVESLHPTAGTAMPAVRAARTVRPAHHAKRLTPAQEINARNPY
jgi:hypothetical protein